MNASRVDFEALFAHERLLLMEARHRDAIRFRWAMVLITLVLALLGRWTDNLGLSYTAVTAIAAGTLLANAAALAAAAKQRFAAWQFWAMVLVDSLLLFGVTLALEEHGYLMLPLVVVTVTGYSLGMPRAAQLQLALASFAYPVGRYFGLSLADIPPTVGIIGLETLFLIGLGWLAAVAPTTFTLRLRRVRAGIARVEHGDLTVRLPHGHLDDIGFLSVSFNRTLETLGRMVEEIQDQARSLAAVSEQMAATAHEIQGSAEQIGDTTASLAEEASQQLDLVAAGREASLAAVEQSQSLGSRAEDSAGSAREQARDAGRRATEAERAATLLLEIRDDFERLRGSVESLDRARDQIGGFVSTIQEIARQTDLLALNAAIEAARAGDEGRGFAVVADEIRKLATQSARSAQHVTASVEQVRTAIGDVRGLLDEGGQRLAGVGEVAESGRGALAAMVGSFESAAALIESFAEGIRRQSDGVQRLRHSMERVEEIARSAMDGAQHNAASTQQQVAAMEELAATTQQLAGMAEDLDALAGRFILPGRELASPGRGRAGPDDGPPAAASPAFEAAQVH